MQHLVRLFYFEMKRQLAHAMITEGVGEIFKNVYKTLMRSNAKKK